jgi:predicted enzyme related to lactoylglutathione lyase
MEKMNPVNWFEIAVNDLERAKNFYTKVFNCQFQPMEMPGMKMYMFEGGPEHPGAAGSLIQTEQAKPSTVGTTIYFWCEDLANEISRIEGAGGQLIMPMTSIGEFGFIAMFIDTEGNKIGLHSTK